MQYNMQQILLIRLPFGIYLKYRLDPELQLYEHLHLWLVSADSRLANRRTRVSVNQG